MATADRTLMLKLIADVNQPTKAVKGLGASLKKAGSAAKAWGKAFAGALVIGGIEKVVDSLGDAYQGFRDGEDAAKTLGQTWRSLGRDADQLGGVIDRIGGRAIDLGFDDAEVLRAFNTFLTKTGSVKDATAGIQAAMNLARAKGISFARAVKIVQGSLGDLGPELRRNRRQAERWARNHPLEVGLNAISDSWEEFVGQFSRGNIGKAFAALGNIGATINDLLFGKEITKGGKTVRTKGLIDQFTAVGGRIVDAIVGGLVDLGGRIQTAWDTQIATVDWSKAIPDALGTFWTDTLQPFLQGLADKGPIATAAVVGLSVALAAMGIAALPISLPIIAIGLAVAALTAGLLVLAPEIQKFLDFLQSIQTKIQEVAQPALDALGGAFDSLADGLQTALDTISPLFDEVLGHIANAAGIVGGVIQGLIDAWNTLQRLVNPQRTGMSEALRLWLAQHGKPSGGHGGGFATGGIVTRPTIGLIGEAGPEAVIPLDRMGSLGGITVNVYAGVGDPVAIGREVDRVLRSWRSRSGTH